jgi:hypothetical protein
VLVVFLVADIAGAPTRVDELPFSTVYAYCVPSVTCGIPWWGALAGFHGGVAVAFAVPGYNAAFEAGFQSDGGVKASVTSTYSQAGVDGVLRLGAFDFLAEEGDGVVGDVVVEPGEDCSGFVGGG